MFFPWGFGPAGAHAWTWGPAWSLAGLEPGPAHDGGFLLPLLLWCFGRDAPWSQGLSLEPLVAGSPAFECCPHPSPACSLPLRDGATKGEGPWPQKSLPSGPAEKTLSRDQASDRSCSTVERLPRGEGARETYGELRLCADREKRHTETQSDVSKTFHVVEVLSNSLMSPNGMAEQPVSQARLGSCPAKAQKERSGLEVLL